MADLSLELCGVKLKNPIIAASGTYGFGREFDELYDISQIGGISVKGLSLKPRTGNPPSRIAETLPSNRFEFILASSDGAFRKPSEWIFRRALSRAGIGAGKCWFIGDDVRCDIEGAARAGIWPVWYRSPLRCTYKPAAKAPPECPHTVVTSWDELGVMLRGLI